MMITRLLDFLFIVPNLLSPDAAATDDRAMLSAYGLFVYWGVSMFCRAQSEISRQVATHTSLAVPRRCRKL